MLTQLKLDNFKIWKSTGPIRLAPVTLLLGTNSSGKSSLIQSLLLIRQTVKGNESAADLNFGEPGTGESLSLGQFKDVLCRHGSNRKIGVEFKWTPTGNAIDSRVFNASYRVGPNGSAELERLRLGGDGRGFTVIRSSKSGVYRLYVGDQRKSLGQSADFRPQRSFAFSEAVIVALGVAGEHIKDVGPQLLEELSRIIYVGPIRRLAQRDYVWRGRMPAHIDDDGSQAVEALIASHVASQSAEKRREPPPAEARLFAETVRWLGAMDLADTLAVKSMGHSRYFELLIQREGEWSNLKDVGVGVSQVLPVIVAALYAKRGDIVIVEEPESHLHPLAEAQLAELFADVSKKRGVQFIIETHSEHLFRRMQTLMARQALLPADCAMYFVERDGPNAKLRELIPDNVGRIENWPPRFFGDVLGETREQTRLALEHLKRQNAP